MSDRLGHPVIMPVGGTIDSRVEAVGQYRSELPTIFRFTGDYAATLEEFARRTGNGAGPAERLWPIPG